GESRRPHECGTPNKRKKFGVPLQAVGMASHEDRLNAELQTRERSLEFRLQAVALANHNDSLKANGVKLSSREAMKREYVTNGNNGTNGRIHCLLSFSVCSVISVCSVFSLRFRISLT
ncbi:MAG: hypothetical protein L0Y75_02235, partial [Acidobacteria bacterium]|nr:hypothetical protein [Acidobacteriota bacterium]